MYKLKYCKIVTHNPSSHLPVMLQTLISIIISKKISVSENGQFSVTYCVYMEGSNAQKELSF